VDLRTYAFTPVILEEVPSLAAGTARLETVEIGTGDVYLNPLTLQPENLRPLLPILPSGCAAADCIRSFQGGKVAMDRISADFRIREGVLWSDGEPMQASDSVLSFHLDSDNATLSTKYLVDRTASYEALDDRTVRWTGIPGYLESDLGDAFWSPLPEHRFGQRSASELLLSADATRSPLGWGPYVLKEWDPGKQIRMERNPNYFRAAEGLPAFDQLVFRFLGGDPRGGLQQILTGECDVLDEQVLFEDPAEAAMDPATLQSMLELHTQRKLQVVSVAGDLVERLEFNTQPPSRQVVTPFADLKVRQAMAACIDRPGLVTNLLGGLGSVTDSFLPANHPLYQAADPALPYAPARAAELLEEAGWHDEDLNPATPRTARAVRGIAEGSPLQVTLTVPEGKFHQALASLLGKDLAACGIGLDVRTASVGALLSPWPDGLAFGRSFQALTWAWPTLTSPACEVFAGWEIPGDSTPGGLNASGYSNEAYDAACRTLLVGGEIGRTQAASLQQQLAEGMPSLPLFQRPRLVVTAASLCGLQADASTLTQLWSLEELQRAETCPAEGAVP
jgi:peptide/nickel transport system substrate-binding protein